MVGSTGRGSGMKRSRGRALEGMTAFPASPGRGSRSKANRGGIGPDGAAGVRRFGGATGDPSGDGAGGAGGSASAAGTIRPRPRRSVTADAPATTAVPTALDVRLAMTDTSVRFRGPIPWLQAYQAVPPDISSNT